MGEDITTICDLINSDGVWDFSRLSFVLPQTIIDSIGPTPIQRYVNGDDCLSWIDSKSGTFCPTSAYLLADNLNSGAAPNHIWARIWKVNTYLKLKISYGFAAKRKLLVMRFFLKGISLSLTFVPFVSMLWKRLNTF